MPGIEPTLEPSKSPPEQHAARISQSYWQLVWWKFRHNRSAMVGGIGLMLLYLCCGVLAEFFAPYSLERISDFLNAPPQVPHFIDAQGTFHLQPFVYGYEKIVDLELMRKYYILDQAKTYPLVLFCRGETYRLFGLFKTNIHFYGVESQEPNAGVFLFGSDNQGRDLLSRIIYGGRISLLIGLSGEIIGLLLGTIVGTLSGFFGGFIDNVVQRLIELLVAFPTIPLWMALASVIPPTWSPIAVWFALTIILGVIGFGGMARQIRGLTLTLREREFVLAARCFGVSDWNIMTRHLIPNVFSHIIVLGTLAVPAMILGETALSFLGLGLRPPVTSWGVLLKEAQNLRVLEYSPWLMIPALFVILTVLTFNLLGDGLRDATDPYST